ncbi:hypothetical protein CR513_34673, partial [Mucuna pruriens]
MVIFEPECYEEASNKEVWVKAMEEEIKMIKKNNTWELVDCPHGKDVIRVKWIYKTKVYLDGTIQKHKARLVAKEEVYVEQPEGFINKGNEGKYFSDQGLERSKSESTLYIKTQGQYDILIVFLYVDDLIYTRKNMEMMNGPKEDMMKTFEMTDLDLMNYFLNIEKFKMYLQGTKEFDIWYKIMMNPRMIGYANRSRIFSWTSKKQAIVEQSTIEAKYVATTESTSQAIWLRRVLEEMGERQDRTIVIYYNNKSTINVVKNTVHH